MEGFPKYEASQNLPDVNFARFAESIGPRGIRIERPEDVADTWEEAFRRGPPGCRRRTH